MAEAGGDYTDQAAGLRRLFSRARVRVVAFAAGSHGVGKSQLVANLATCLAQQGRLVWVVDENATSTVAASFGHRVTGDLDHVVRRGARLADVLVPVAPGVRVLPVADSVARLGKLDETQQHRLLASLATLDESPEVILVDSSPEHPLGFSPFALAAHDSVIVMAPTPASITEAYALIKKVSLAYARRSYRVLVNGVRNPEEGRAVFGNMARVTHGRRFARLEYAGSVPLDEHVRQAVSLAQPVASLYPLSPAARACSALAGDLAAWLMRDDELVELEQFFLQLLHFSQHIDPVAIYA